MQSGSSLVERQDSPSAETKGRQSGEERGGRGQRDERASGPAEGDLGLDPSLLSAYRYPFPWLRC